MRITLKAACFAAFAMAVSPMAHADTFNFSFNGGGITSSGTITAMLAPDNISGVNTPDSYEITGISGLFTDSNDGISGAITGIYTPLSYVTGLTATVPNPIAFTSNGLSYDDLLFPAGNSPADCPGYPFSGGELDVYGVAFNIAGGYIGEFFSNGDFPGFTGPVYGAADGNLTSVLDNPNPGGLNQSMPEGVIGAFTAETPEPGSLALVGIGGLVLAAIRRANRTAAK